MSENKLRLAIIIGSNRHGRLGDRVAAWVTKASESTGRFSVDVIDIALLDLPPDYPAMPTESVLDLRQRIDQAAAFVVVTPEYNHSFPGPLKHVLDQAYEEWRAKPVALVSYGGQSGGLRAAEALRLVFAEMHAVTIRDGLSFAQAWTTFDQKGGPDAEAGVAAGIMFGQLAWWGAALRHARQEFSLDDYMPEKAAE
jgi:NAD(P)H-dependent FMN reductase